MIARLRATRVPRGALLALCLVIIAPPAGMAIGHSLHKIGGNWVHHHTRDYSYCNMIDPGNAMYSLAGEAIEDFDSRMGSDLDFANKQTNCHPASADPVDVHLEPGNFGQTGWRVSVLNANNANNNAGFHSTHWSAPAAGRQIRHELDRAASQLLLQANGRSLWLR